MKKVIDLNADAGESFGRWPLGDDAALAPYLTSISVACGFHAGDPSTMRRSARLAAASGVALGAHPGLPDLLGFGRRAMNVCAEEVADYCAYQVGALQAIAALEGAVVEHVKPHGALYAMCSHDPEVAFALARAVVQIDPQLMLLLQDGAAATAADSAGARVAREAFIDIEYDDEGDLIIEAVTGHRDPGDLALRALGIVEGVITTRSGRRLEVDADSICIHGDGPSAVAIARSVRARLEDAGVALNPLREIVPRRS